MSDGNMCNASFESVIKNECDEQVGPATVNDSTNSTNSEGLGVAKFYTFYQLDRLYYSRFRISEETSKKPQAYMWLIFSCLHICSEKVVLELKLKQLN